jgi:hypothetical protein
MTPYFARLAQRAGAEVRSPSSGRWDAAQGDAWGEQVAEVSTASDTTFSAAAPESPQIGESATDVLRTQPAGVRAEVVVSSTPLSPPIDSMAIAATDSDTITTAAGVAATPTLSAMRAAAPNVLASATTGQRSQTIVAGPDETSGRTSVAPGPSSIFAAVDETVTSNPDHAGTFTPRAYSTSKHSKALSTAVKSTARSHRSESAADGIASRESSAATPAVEVASAASRRAVASHATTAQPASSEISRNSSVTSTGPRPAPMKSTGIEVSIGRVDVEIIGAPPAPRSAASTQVSAPAPAAVAPRAGFNARRHYLRGS